MDYIMFGTRMREARKRKNYTQAHLAEEMGYSVQHISHAETTSTKISVEFLVSLSNSLDTSLDRLLQDSLLKDNNESKSSDYLDMKVVWEESSTRAREELRKLSAYIQAYDKKNKK